MSASGIGIGSVVDGKYALVELAGQGGMATVYRAVVRGAAGFSRQVAVKRMRPEFRGMQNYVDMFIEEARVGAELAHPNIVQVVDFLQDDVGAYYLVMEWVDGLDMGSWLQLFRDKGQRPDWRLVVTIVLDALRGLGAAHERQRLDGTPAPVIHRDVSPHNILLAVNGVAKLTDFGLARARDRVAKLTAPGTVKGKLAYMSPEVSWGEQATARSDLFAVGCVMWEGLVGHRPFDGKTDIDIFRAIRDCKPAALGPLRPDVPVALVGIIEGALAKDPNDRYQTAPELAQALRGVLALYGGGFDGEIALRASVAHSLNRVPTGQHALPSQPTELHPASLPRPDDADTVERQTGSPHLKADGKTEGSGSMEIEFTQAAIKVPPGDKR